VDDFWQFVHFTDEAHVDPSELRQGYILRVEGTRYNPENTQEMPDKKGVKLHMAAWINWHSKSPEIEFYNDENDYVQPPKRPRKPRKSKYETVEAHKARVIEWEATLPHEVDIKPKGNSMTQQYYTERLLPIYIKAIEASKA
jgi:hypothetical protein